LERLKLGWREEPFEAVVEVYGALLAWLPEAIIPIREAPSLANLPFKSLSRFVNLSLSIQAQQQQQEHVVSDT
jgi:hypothetical protein